MRASNSKAVDYLLSLGYDEIWLKSHTRYNDMIYCKDQAYPAKDVWNLFDGFCSKDKIIHAIQVKTNKFEDPAKYEEFQYDHANNLPVLLINVYKSGNRWKVTHKVIIPKHSYVTKH